MASQVGARSLHLPCMIFKKAVWLLLEIGLASVGLLLYQSPRLPILYLPGALQPPVSWRLPSLPWAPRGCRGWLLTWRWRWIQAGGLRQSRRQQWLTSCAAQVRWGGAGWCGVGLGGVGWGRGSWSRAQQLCMLRSRRIPMLPCY